MATKFLKKSIFFLQLCFLTNNLISEGNRNNPNKQDFLKSIKEAGQSLNLEEQSKRSEKVNNALETAYKKMFLQIIEKHKYTPQQAEALIAQTLMVLQTRTLGSEYENNIAMAMKEYSCSRDEALVLVASAIVLKAQTHQFKQEPKLKTKIDYENDFDATIKYKVVNNSAEQPQIAVPSLKKPGKRENTLTAPKKAPQKKLKIEKDPLGPWGNKVFGLVVAIAPAAVGLIGRFIFDNKTSNQNQALVLAQNPILSGMWKISVNESEIENVMKNLKKAKDQIASFNVKIKPQELRLTQIENFVNSKNQLEYQSELLQYPVVKRINGENVALIHVKQGFIDWIFGGIADTLINDNSQVRIKNLLLNEYRETLLKVFEQRD